MMRIVLFMSLALSACMATPAVAADPIKLPYVLDAGDHRISADGVVILNADGSTATGSQGTVASATTDSGNPVKIGCVYNSALPAVTTGQRVDWQCAPNGGGLVVLTGTNGAFASVANANSDDVAISTPALATRSFMYFYDATGVNEDRARGDANGLFVAVKGTSSLSTAQVSVGTSSTLIAAARAGRSKITVAIGAANGCALGNSGVTTSTGLLLPAVAGTTFTLDSNAALYGACTSTTTVSFVEQY